MPILTVGEVTISSGARDALDAARIQPESLLKRHRAGDWGDLSPESREWNTQAVELGERILSVYAVSPETRIWIVTAADRSSTTVLLPSEAGRPIGKQVTGKNGRIAHEIIEAACDGKLVEEIIKIAQSVLELALEHDDLDVLIRAQIIGKICWRYGLEPPDDVIRWLMF